jgi:segregation and condensation protein B
MALPEKGMVEMEIYELESIIESLLFACGDALPLDKICEITGLDKKTCKNIIENMMTECNKPRRGVIIREINNAYQFCTRPENSEYLSKLFEPRQRQGLSPAAYETLAIVAYNRPITRAKIEQVRGVSSDSAISKLLDKNLIQEAGRLDCPGKPILYETTDEFLRSFGLRSLADLPPLDGLEYQITKDSDED